MDLLNAMRHFTAVADAKSFSRAAARLGLGTATVSQSVKNLEDHLGVRLLNRNTRHVALTEEGLACDTRCREALAKIDEIQASVLVAKDQVAGRMSVEIPYAIGRAHILPQLPAFLAAHPQLETTILLNPGSGRLIEEGIDVAIQLGTLPSSSLIARRIHTMRYLACAAPAYLERHGTPEDPAALQRHACIGFWSPNTHRLTDWTFERADAISTHTPCGPVHFNSSEAAIALAREGAGIVYMPDLLVTNDLKIGTLIPILTGWATLERPVYLVTPHRRHVPAKVKAFSAFAVGLFSQIRTDIT